MTKESNLNILPNDSLIPIRTISSLTGVNPVTLRAWERRYKLLTPTRTPKGHRLYSMADVELIKQVVVLLEGGMSISQVKQVLAEQQEGISAPVTPKRSFDVWYNYQERLLQAIAAFDEETINETYNELLGIYPIDIVTSRLIVPLLQELGWRWQRGSASGIAEEHFFSVFLRNKLGARFHHRSRLAEGPVLLTACLPGEQHEVGLLLFALVAQDWDYRVIMLGANTPVSELSAVAQRCACHALVLSGSTVNLDEGLQAELKRLTEQIYIPVFIGGRITEQSMQALAQLGIENLSSDFATAVKTISARLLSKS